MRKLTVAILPPVLLASAAVFGQVPPPPPGPPPGPGENSMGPNFVYVRGPQFTFDRNLKPILNAPYQAEAVSTTTQHLADGNVIEMNHTTKMARDKQGRTWTEETLDHMGPWSSQDNETRTLIFIFDPVAGYSYTLHPETKTAERRPSKGQHETMMWHGRAPAGPGAPEGAMPTVTAPPAVPAMPAIPAYRIGPPDSKDAKVEDLGTQVINGVPAQGKRTTHTIPANTIGNQLPIVNVDESWFSPELQTVVESKRTDPRFGDTVFDLKNIQKGDPPAALFQVPGDYTVKDARGFAAVRRKP
jgi:hypothetical protein